jgi:hypothetical protein
MIKSVHRDQPVSPRVCRLVTSEIGSIYHVRLLQRYITRSDSGCENVERAEARGEALHVVRIINVNEREKNRERIARL